MKIFWLLLIGQVLPLRMKIFWHPPNFSNSSNFWYLSISVTIQVSPDPRKNIMSHITAGSKTILYPNWIILKACVHYFLRNVYSPLNDRPLKTVKDVFYFIQKALFVLKIFKFLYFHLPLFFSLSVIAWELDPK